jgi:glycerol-3-phosphate cytidylyltransferase
MTKKKIILNAGIYDLCHFGHLNLLRRMKDAGDRLVVVIHDDLSCFKIKDKFPVQTLAHRIRNLKLTGLVDEIVVTRNIDPYLEFNKILIKYKKHEIIYMRGDDLKDNFPGQWLLKQRDIKIKFLPYTKGVSSTKIRDMLIK